MSEKDPLQELAEIGDPKVPPVGNSLRAALDEMKPVVTRRPVREFRLFIIIATPCFALVLFLMGFRPDLRELPVVPLTVLSALWFTSFAAAAFLAFVPPKQQVMPRVHRCRQLVIGSSLLFVLLGLFVTELSGPSSMTYSPSVGSVAAHAPMCAAFGLSAGIMPGLIALLLMRRSVAVGKTSIGLALGAAGGSLSGLILMFRCGVAERFHVGLVHGSVVVAAALTVALISRRLLR